MKNIVIRIKCLLQFVPLEVSVVLYPVASNKLHVIPKITTKVKFRNLSCL